MTPVSPVETALAPSARIEELKAELEKEKQLTKQIAEESFECGINTALEANIKKASESYEHCRRSGHTQKAIALSGFIRIMKELQQAFCEKRGTSSPALRIATLEAQLAQAKLQYETEAKWRIAYQEAKGKMYEAGGELATWAVDNMPCNEAQIDAWFRKEYVYRKAYERLESQLAAAQRQAAEAAALAERMREALMDMWGAAASLVEAIDAAGLQFGEGANETLSRMKQAEAALAITPTAALTQYRDRVLEEVAQKFEGDEFEHEDFTQAEIAAEIRAMKGTK